MNTIKINAEVADQTPEEFKNLEQGTYKLTKTENFRAGFVYSGDTVTGPLEIVEIIGKPGVKVLNANMRGPRDTAYIRTSPIVKVVDKTENTVTFETEGGVYKLEKVDASVNS